MKNLIIFLVFGCTYLSIEVIFKGIRDFDLFGWALIGHTSVWMLFIGGLASLLVGLVNEKFIIPLPIEMLIGGLIITVIELVSGLFFNLYLGFNLWNYDDMKFNIYGQVCLIFSGIWCCLVPCIKNLDDILRRELRCQKVKKI